MLRPIIFMKIYFQNNGFRWEVNSCARLSVSANSVDWNYVYLIRIRAVHRGVQCPQLGAGPPPKGGPPPTSDHFILA